MAKKNRISVNNAAGIFFFIAAVAATYCGITLASDVVEAIIFYGTAAFSVFFTIIYWYYNAYFVFFVHSFSSFIKIKNVNINEIIYVGIAVCILINDTNIP